MGALIRWFLENKVAANLLMVGLLAAGIASALTVTVRTFPEITPEAVLIEVAYPGATPTEVADAILDPIEQQLLGLEGIREITSIGAQEIGTVQAELTSGADIREVRNDIETELARITTFPEESEAPRISELERDELAIQIALTGDSSLATLKAIAEEARDAIVDLPGVSRAELVGTPVDQIDIAVRQETLRAYDIGLTALADRIRAGNVDLSSGVIDTGASEIQVRAAGESETADGFRDLLLFASENGARVELGDIALINDTFEETATGARLDGRPAVFLSVYREGTEQVLDVVDQVQRYLGDTLAPTLPEGLEATVWRNEAQTLQSRINLLAENGMIGVALILFILMLFLDIRIAAWVAAGVVVAFVGAFTLMAAFGVTINQLSLFGFILALGIVVDDAIVVGENVYAELERSEDAEGAAKRGVGRVWLPTLFSVSTTIVAFIPLLFLPGSSGSFIAPVAAVVIFVLLVSLTESFFVLPKHLSHIRVREPRRWSPRRVTEATRRRVDRAFQRFTAGPLRRVVDGSIRHPLFVVAACGAILLAASGLIAGGLVKFVFFPDIEGDYVVAELEFPEGTSDVETLAQAQTLSEAAQRAAERLGGGPLLQSVAITQGFQTESEDPVEQGVLAGNIAQIEAKLQDADQREIAAQRFLELWREEAGTIPGVEQVIFSASVVGIGEPIVIEVSAEDEASRNTALGEIRARLSERPGVFDIRDDRFSAAQEIAIDLKPAAAVYGVTLDVVANELRAALFGDIIDQFAREREEVDVRLRLVAEQRDSIADLLELRIPADGGGLIPIGLVADLSFQPAPTEITRIDGRTVATLTADVDTTVSTGGAETAWVLSDVVPELTERFPSLQVTKGGEQEEAGRFGAALQFNFAMAVFAIYAILALAFSSYTRPLIVLAVLPFGFVGAVLGHALLGIDLTLLSMFGIVGLSGVIVNAALLIVDFTMEGEREGKRPADAIRDAALSRFRPIMLTTLTTFFGITPLILETSVQAQFLVPTAVALGFGVLFASILQIALVPALSALHARARGRRPAPRIRERPA